MVFLWILLGIAGVTLVILGLLLQRVLLQADEDYYNETGREL